MGLVVALAVGFVVFWAVTGIGDDPDPDPTGPTEAELDAAADAADAFLRAHERSLGATYTGEGTFVRTVDGRDVVVDPVVVVQRPPDRLTLGFGSWDGIVGGRAVSCDRDGRAGEFRSCASPAPGDQAALDAEAHAELEGLVSGADAIYLVTDLGDGCFRLRLVERVRFLPDHGSSSGWCFDAATGAVSLRRVERPDSIDETRLDRIVGRVDPADLTVPT